MQTQPWSIDTAKQWYERQPWIVGCNFIPSTAINPLEMWQADTFDPRTIDRELGWAADLGFNAVRVNLHDLLWKQDPAGFKERLDHFLGIASGHAIRTMFVLFDDCWHDDPRLGPQPAPRPGVHNSGWVKSPGTRVLRDPTQWDRLEGYVTDLVSSFGRDERVLLWDVYNEPGNDFITELNLPAPKKQAHLAALVIRQFLGRLPTEELLKKTFAWARGAHPSQPLTCGSWYLVPGVAGRLCRLGLELSDVVSFHSYFDLPATQKTVAGLRRYGRPLLCTEYMARTANCRFETHLPYFKQERIGALNWGLVSGKTQTIYSWQDRCVSGEEPPLWYHDIFRPDGTIYREKEGEMIKEQTGAKRSSFSLLRGETE
jgi:hypothetical protein